jgi:hypothetical protein
MTKIRVVGLIVILLRISMFLIGIAGFSGSLPNSFRELGIISFSYWFPALAIGIILTTVGKKRNG